MLLKFLTHLFCSSSLERERSKTDSAVAEYQQKEAQVKARLTRQAEEYRDLANVHQAKRNKELDEFVAILNTTVTSAHEYLLDLAQFEDFVFVAFNSWMRIDLEKKQIDLLSEKLRTLYASLDLLNAYEAEINRLTQKEERHAWHLTVKERPVRISSDLVEATIDQLVRTRNTSARQFKEDIKRIMSHKLHLRGQIRDLENQRDEYKNGYYQSQKEHDQVKAELSKRYKHCTEKFKAIRATLEDYYCRQPTKSNVANSWIYALSGLIHTQNLKDLHRNTKDEFETAKLEYHQVRDERSEILDRIQQCRDTDDYSDFSSLKTKKLAVQDHFNLAKTGYLGINDARKAIYERPKEVNGLLTRLDKLLPDQSILNIMKIFDVDDTFNPMRAIGVSTDEQRRLHWKKNNKDGVTEGFY
jgi:methionine synthase II (cobalamin-independent)